MSPLGSDRFYTLSDDERPNGSGLPFGRGDVQTPIHRVTRWHSLSPHSSARSSDSFSCDPPTHGDRWVELRVYPVPLERHEWGRPCLSAGGLQVSVPRTASGTSGHAPFGSGLTAAWACQQLRRLRQFTFVGRTTQPCTSSALLLAESCGPLAGTAYASKGMIALLESLGPSPVPGPH